MKEKKHYQEKHIRSYFVKSKITKLIKIKWIKRVVVLVLITAFLTETVTRPDLFTFGNNKAYADTVSNTGGDMSGNQPEAGTGLPDTIKTENLPNQNETPDAESVPNGEPASGLENAPYSDTPDTGNISDTEDTGRVIPPPEITGVPALSEDTGIPAAPSNVTAAVATGSAIFISWDAPGDNVGVAGYRIYRDDVEIGTAVETNYTDTSCTEGNTYTYSIKVYDAAGNLSEAGIGIPVTLGTTLQEEAVSLFKPMDLTVTVREAVIVVRWGSVTYADSYELSINRDIIDTGYDTSYIQTQVISNHTYEYRVRVKSGEDVSEWSDPVYLTTGPDKVLNLNAVTVNELTVELSWDTAEGATAYEIECNGNILDTVTDSSYTHNLAASSESLIYRVRAVNGEGKGIWSDPLSLSTEIIIPEGTIAVDTVWDGTAGIYMVQGDITIDEGVTLQIMSGTIVKFAPAVGMTVKGNLIAGGTNELPVIITSEKNPQYGGSGISGEDDYFTGIYVESTGEFTGDYVRISDGGGDYSTGYYNSSIVTAEGKLNLNYSEISDSNRYGITVDSDEDVTIQNSIVQNSGYYNIYIDRWYSSAGTVTLSNNIIQNGMDGGIYVDEEEKSNLIIENNTIQGNGEYGICINEHGTGIFRVSGNNILNNTGFPLYIDLEWIKSASELENLHNNNLDGNKPADLITLTGYLSIDLTLKDNYMFDSIIVDGGINLTIQPGTVLFAPPGYGTISIGGKMIAEGTAKEPIIFTSVLDPEYGGSGITGTEDCWGEIYVYQDGEFIGDNIKVKYGGGGNEGGALCVKGKLSLNHSGITGSLADGITIESGEDVTIQNSIIEASQSANIGIGDHIIIWGLVPVINLQKDMIQQDDSDETRGTITIRNNILRDASYSGIFLSQPGYSRVIVEDNTIENNGDYPVRINLWGTWSSEAVSNMTGNIFSGNLASDRICLYGDLYKDLTLPQNEYKYEVEGRISIPEETTLTIQPGSFLLMNCQSNAGMEIGGELIADGTTEEPVVFTSSDDSEYGGNLLTGAGSKWEGLSIKSTGEFTGNNVKIRNGGYWENGEYSGAVYVGGKLNLYYSEVTGSYGYGIYYNTTAQSALLYNSFADNPYAVYNANDNTIINASRNYWNSIYGPSVYKQVYDPVKENWNPEWNGNGEKVYGKVDYSPYLGFDLTGTVHFGESEGAYAPTGNYSKQFTDLSVNCTEDTLTFTRLYNSQNTEETGVFGKGWTFNYESGIKDNEVFDDIKMVTLPDGSQESYTQKDDGSYTANSSRNTLVKQADGSYILTTREQVKYGFNTEGTLTWMESKEGNRLTVRLNPEGKPQGITDYAGRDYQFTYEGGLLVTITGPAGRTVQYGYDNNRLFTVTDPDGITTYYGYDDNGNLSEIRDANHDLTEAVTYRMSDGLTQVDQITDACGNVKTYTYDDVSGKTIITDSNGNTTTQWYDITYNITYTTDAEGRTRAEAFFTDEGVNKYGEIKAETDRNGNTTTYERDARGNITKIINPDSSSRRYTYDEKNNITGEQDEEGRNTYYIYNSDKTYLLKMIKPLNGSDTYSETSDQEDFAITSYTYYGEGENGYSINGLVRSVTEPEGYVSSYTYDPYGNVQSETDGTGNTTIYTNSIIGFRTSTLSPKGGLTTYAYNNNGNPVRIVTDGGETTHIIYDGLGRKVQELKPNINQSTPEGDVGYRYTYYKSGMPHTVTDPEDNTTVYTYDLYGNLLTETRPNGCIYAYEYDVMNRVIKESVQDSEASDKIPLKSYTYSILSDHTTRKKETVYLNDTDTADTTYVYDYADRPVEQVNPDGGIIFTEYYANGNVDYQADAMDNTTYYWYDGLNRLAEQWTPFEDGSYTYQKYIYDKNGNRIAGKTGIGAVSLWDVPETLVTTSYTYDRDNRVVSMTDPADGRTEYEYDADGNKEKETVYLDGDRTKVTEYEYNHLGKPVKVIQHVEAGDIYGNDSGSTADLLLVTTYTYDADGNVITMTTPDNITTSYEYDKLDRPVTQSVPVLDEYGNQTVIVTATTYDYAGNIISSADGNGNITRNIYNRRGLLEKTIDTTGGTTAYYYDRAGRLTENVLPENYKESTALSGMTRTVFIYDEMDRVVLEQDIYYDKAAGAWKTIHAKANGYDLNGNVIKTLDALGYESGTGEAIWEKINSGYGTEYAYNDANLLITTLSPVSKDNGLAYDIRYAYDGAGRKITETNAKGVVINYEYDNAGRLIKTTVKDTADRVTQQASYDGMGNVLTETDGNGNTTTYTYNRLGLVKSRTTPGDASEPSDTTVYQYDGLGRQAYQKDSMGKVKQFTYDHDGNILTETEEKEDGTQGITTCKAYDKDGNLRFETDANGDTTEYGYDTLNRVVYTRQTVDGKVRDTLNTYDKNGNQLTETDWLGNTYTNGHDALNRLLQKTDPYGKVVEKYEYNNNHAQIKAYDALDNVTEYAYDKNNRLIRTTGPSGHSTSQTYDKVGNLATKTDGNGNVTTYGYDAFNRLTKVTNAKNEVTGYTYDLDGNLLTQKDGKGNTVTYTYNTANKVIRKAEPKDASGVSQTESYTYHADGTMKTKTGRNGNTTSYAYDIHGNLLTETAGSDLITYTYDPKGNMRTMTDATGKTTRAYDELGRVLTKTVPHIGIVSFEYDNTEDTDPGCYREIATDPKGNATVKVYDKAGRLSKVIVGNDITTYTYYDNGNRESVIYNDGSKEEYTYYPNNQVETLINKKADGSIMDSYSYTYDNAGNQLTKHEVINGVEKGTTAYTYDTLNRLLTVTEPEPEGRVTTYEYDKAGNRLKETITITDHSSGSTATTENTYAYNNQNRLTDITTKVNNVLNGVTNYTYDKNGNQLTTVVKTYTGGAVTSTETTEVNTYDIHNQLMKTVTEDGTIVNNTYNAEGYRTGKEVNGDKTYYLYEADQIILEVDKDGNQTARNVHGTNLIRRTVNGETYYYLYNGHADVTSLITGDGTIAATYYYDAFGNILESTGEVDNNIRYSGYQYDEETGLYYLNTRMYDPKTARFLQEDTYTGDPNDPLSLNLYTYCINNPVIYWDPTGHSFWSATGNFFGGLWDGLKDTATEAVNTVKHPVKTVKDIGKAAAHPVKTGKAIY
ncbi:MAG: RHS repeat-associated core domain-containing protein, partial [Anaerocolumna sp.]